MLKQVIILLSFSLISIFSYGSYIIIPMGEDNQSNHLKAYGIAYWVLQNDIEVDWLLNYDGGS
ncbi:MAG: asparagine synthetase B, partial [Flavobacteriales bacterium]|nr:asparagine synthetase B [Flavobacteriales bacterium]